MRHPSLNFTYRLVFSTRLDAYIPVPEVFRSAGRGRASAVMMTAVLAGMLGAGTALADTLPTGGTVVGGAGSISQSGDTMDIHQSTGSMAINWQSFSIGAGNTVNFHQPSASAVALNRVLGSDVSVIQGALNANGQVFLVNPNGVLFSTTAQVNVGGLVASTLDISVEDFMAGTYAFEGASGNALVNQGTITAQEGGSVALIAARIENTGTITANEGAVVIGAGRKVTLNLGGPVSIEVEEGALQALIEQGGAIKADGGLVYLTAKAAGDLVSTVINHTGVTEAQTLASGQSGEIFLMGDMHNGRIAVAGRLDASAPHGGDGGFIETSAAQVQAQEGLVVTTQATHGETGTWLIDPNDYTVAATDGDITGAALSANLGTTSVTIQSVDGATIAGNGDIFVKDAVTWSSGNTLTLNALRNIEINAALDASGGTGGRLVLEYGQGAVAADNTATYLINAPVSLQNGMNFTTKLGSDGENTDYAVYRFQNDPTFLVNLVLANSLGANIALGSGITMAFGEGDFWAPVGNTANRFTGNFEGLGNSIEGLLVSGATGFGNPDNGFFGYTDGAMIRNLRLVNVDVSGANVVGALAGRADNTQIVNVSVTGAVAGDIDVGGLIGKSQNTTIDHSHTDVAITRRLDMLDAWGRNIGGLVGDSNVDMIGHVAISRSSAVGSINAGGARNVGGLVGNHIGTISDSYSTVAVAGGPDVGGLVGLVGVTEGDGTNVITNSFAAGSVTATGDAGGLIGKLDFNFEHEVGATVTVNNSFWDTQATGQAESAGAGAVGKTTAEMQALALFNDAEWNIVGDPDLAADYPRLTWAMPGSYGSHAWVISVPASPTVAPATSTPRQDVQSARPTVTQPALQGRTLGLSGSLAFVDVGDDAALAEGGGGIPVPAGFDQAGLDPFGFMRVFVVGGGINLPPGSTSAEGSDDGSDSL